MASTEEKPKSYTQRLKEYLEEHKVSKKTLDLISEFAMEETERREKQREANKNVMTFGKYKNKKIDEIYKLDPTYIKWLSKNEKYLSEQNREVVKELLNNSAPVQAPIE